MSIPAAESLPDIDPDVQQLWEIEIFRREREIEEGSVQLVPWSELRSRLMMNS